MLACDVDEGDTRFPLGFIDLSGIPFPDVIQVYVRSAAVHAACQVDAARLRSSSGANPLMRSSDPTYGPPPAGADERQVDHG